MNLPDKLWTFLSSNLGTKVISVVIAIVLWVVVLGSRNVEVTKDIPLEIITPSDLVASNEVPERITFKLAGPKAFLRAILDRREEPIRVNLSGAKAGLVTYRFFADNIRLPIGVKVMSVNPTAILIKLEPQKKREVPVRPELRGSLPEGYRLVKTVVRPATVRIKGPETRVDSVTEVATLPIDLSNVHSNYEQTASLELDRLGVQIDGPLPTVSIQVEATTANYRIKNVDIRVLTSHKFTLSEKSVTVMVRVDPKDLKFLDRTRVYGVIDLKDRPPGKYTETVKVILPEHVGLVKVLPEKVSVTLH
jgi:YbbR domain-containing protein